MATVMIITSFGVAQVPLATGISTLPRPNDDTFAGFMERRLTDLSESTEAVSQMVQSRSRNILALQAEADRIEKRIQEIDAFLADVNMTPDQVQVAQTYQRGRDLIFEAIEIARSSITSFDFSDIPRAIPIFDDGKALIDEALTMVRFST